MKEARAGGVSSAGQPPSVGMVLSGGGGKGAYEIGCWDALRDLNIPVEAVAGTSVGALNAALVAQGDIKKAQELWGTITAGDVLMFRAARVPALALRILMITGLPYYRASSSSKRSIHLLFLVELALTALLAVIFRIGFGPIASKGMGDLGTGMVVLLIPLLVVGIPILCWFWMERSNVFIFDNEPLRNTLMRHLDVDKVAHGDVQTIIAAAKPIDYFDPEHPKLIVRSSRTTMGYQYYPCLERRYLPVYSTLNGQRRDHIIQLLLTSTSLPFGIFPNRKQTETGWLDGGLADNTPVLPLVRLGCDPIVVVHLNHRLARKRPDQLDAIVGARVATLERMLEIWEYSEYSLQEFIHRYGAVLSDEPCQDDANLKRPKTPMPRLVHIVPSRRLGGLLRGTLRFDPQRASWLMQLGYDDARKALLEYLSSETPTHQVH